MPTSFGVTDRIDWVKKLSESISANDTIAKTATVLKSESIAIVDTKISTATFSRALSESISINDTKATASAFARELGESITIADIKKATNAFERKFDESITLTDGIVKIADKKLSETVTTADAVAKTIGACKTESISLADTDATTVAFSRELNESITVTDNIAKTSTKLLSETITVAGAVTGVISGYYPLPDGHIEVETITSSGHTWTPGNIASLINLHPHIQIECVSGTIVNPTISDGNKTLSWTGSLTADDILTLYPENKAEDKNRAPENRADGQWIILKPNVVYTYTDETVGAFEVKVTINWEDDLYARTQFDDIQTENARITPFSDVIEEDLK